MDSRPKNNFISAPDQGQLLPEFYDQLNEDDSEFSGDQFGGKNGDNNAFRSDSDSDSSKETQRDEICYVELGNVKEEEELENEVQRNQKLRNLNEVLDEDNYDPDPVYE